MNEKLYGYDPNAIPLCIPSSSSSLSSSNANTDSLKKRKRVIVNALNLLVRDVLSSKRKRRSEDLELLPNGMTKGEVSLLIMRAQEKNPSCTQEEIVEAIANFKTDGNVEEKLIDVSEEFKFRLRDTFPDIQNTEALDHFDHYFPEKIFEHMRKDRVKPVLWAPARKFLTKFKLNKSGYTKLLKKMLVDISNMLPT